MMFEKQGVDRLLNNNHLHDQPLMAGMDLMKKTKKNRKSNRGTTAAALQQQEKLEIVDLSGLSLDSLPNPSLNLATITNLHLSNNNLQSIPESLTARLLNVAVLDVHSNQLTSLPNSIGCLSKLKVLDVSGNLLDSLPKTIENCRALEELNANFNKLTKLPETIGFELINLKKLSVNSNKLVFLPHSTSHLTELSVLDVRLNCLRSLPEDLENLINLKILNVSQNFQYLETLPYSVGLLLSLVELDVSYNRIKSLPESIGCLKKLEKLSVEGNPLTSPPKEVVEQGVDKVKEYMCHRLNSAHESPKKRSWVGKLVRCGTINGRWTRNGPTNNYALGPQYRTMEGLGSPSLMAMFSPKRLFSSPRRSV
ncbi:plant intracellular Ras-group-related LRR protein 6-like [Neltuma alba]|uniref:plant intracellular Ras-group-related LRR protein 6-like n=1 Tax=Neltuma alba TaxID=207710 RepID=UPI0010A3BABD|nr:plant intracellular Ras-group-related LRR protein 6-like [Prosopis alba]